MEELYTQEILKNKQNLAAIFAKENQLRLDFSTSN